MEIKKDIVSTIYITKPENGRHNVIALDGIPEDLLSMAVDVISETLTGCPELAKPAKTQIRDMFRELNATKRKDGNWILERVLFYIVGSCAIWGALSMFLSFMGWLMRVMGI